MVTSSLPDSWNRSDGLSHDAFSQRIGKVQHDPDNQVCADCLSRDPEWASFLLSSRSNSSMKCLCVLVCRNCALHHHRELGEAACRIKFVKYFHEWTLDELKVLETSGNAAVNAAYEAFLNEKGFEPNDSFCKRMTSPCPKEEGKRRARFIKNKYVKWRYLDESALERALNKVCQSSHKDSDIVELRKPHRTYSVSSAELRKPYRTCSNQSLHPPSPDGWERPKSHNSSKRTLRHRSFTGNTNTSNTWMGKEDKDNASKQEGETFSSSMGKSQSDPSIRKVKLGKSTSSRSLLQSSSLERNKDFCRHAIKRAESARPVMREGLKTTSRRTRTKSGSGNSSRRKPMKKAHSDRVLTQSGPILSRSATVPSERGQSKQNDLSRLESHQRSRPQPGAREASKQPPKVLRKARCAPRMRPRSPAPCRDTTVRCGGN